MPRVKQLLTPIVCAILITALYSCGGGGDSQVAEGGIGGTGVSQGRVSGFGSIFVNGIEYETGNASFTVNDSEGTQDDLAIGMVVRINGSSDQVNATGEALSVEYDSLIEGVIDSNDVAAANTLTIMNQTITINQDTVFENPVDATPLAELPVNSVVEVSGFTDGSGDILATRIEVVSLAWSGNSLEVSGIVTNISGTQFQIGNLVIEAVNALPIPAEGTNVEVKGRSFSGTVFQADSIIIEGNGTTQVAEDGEEVKIEGRITTALDSQNLFALNGQLVDASTTIYSGQTALLTVGRVAEVDGVMEDNILIAETIKLSAEASEKGELSSVLGVGDVDTTAQTISLLGQTVLVNNSTIMVDDLHHESSFRLSQLEATDYVEAKVYSDNGVLIASKLELDESPRYYTAKVEGRPEFIDSTTIRVFGVIVDISGVDYNFDDDHEHDHEHEHDDGNIEVSGDFIDGVLVATRIERD